jgi:pyrimidine deaminase RibD-like protein
LAAARLDLAGECLPSETAFSVDAVIADAAGESAQGRSGEGDSRIHAEEAVLMKVEPGDGRLDGATMYTLIEPCTRRSFRARTARNSSWRPASAVSCSPPAIRDLRLHGS